MRDEIAEAPPERGGVRRFWRGGGLPWEVDEPRGGMWADRVRVSVGRVLVREPWVVRALAWVLIAAAMVVGVLIAIPIAVVLIVMVALGVLLVAVGRAVEWVRRGVRGGGVGRGGGSDEAGRQNVRVIGPARWSEREGTGPGE